MSNVDDEHDEVPDSDEPLETLVSKSPDELGASDKRPETVERTREILSLYLADIAKVKLLTGEQEQALARRVQDGDVQAERELVEANLRLVVRIARRYLRRGLSPTEAPAFRPMPRGGFARPWYVPSPTRRGPSAFPCTSRDCSARS